MNANTLHVIEIGLRIIEGAWSPLAREIGHLSEGDEELHKAWRQVDDGLAALDRVIRTRLRTAHKAER